MSMNPPDVFGGGAEEWIIVIKRKNAIPDKVVMVEIVRNHNDGEISI